MCEASKILQIIFFFSMPLLLSGCGGFITTLGNTFEGAGDHRLYTEKGTPAETKYIQFDGNQPSHFEPNDYLSIHLKSAYFKNSMEGLEQKAANALLFSPVKSEIAIVINVGQKLEQIVDPASSSNPGKVVFYSGDIVTSQMINQSFGVVYGPVRWTGEPLTIDITVVELDQVDNKNLGGMLTTLARLGTSGTSAAVLSTLNKLGSSFIDSNVDDVIGRYRLTLMPPQTTQDIYAPVLRTGDLVVIRDEDRDEPFEWNNYYYHPEQGELFDGNDEGGTTRPDINYMVLTFVKNAGTIDLTPSLDLAGLSTAIADTNDPEAFKQELQNVADSVTKEMKFVELKKALNVLKSKAPREVKLFEAEVLSESLQCSLYFKLNGEEKLCEAEGRPAVKKAESISFSDYQYFTKFILRDFIAEISWFDSRELLGNSDALMASNRTILRDKLAGLLLRDPPVGAAGE